MYYVIKDVLLLYFYFAFRLFKFILYDVWKMIFDSRNVDEDDDDEEESDEEQDYEEEDITFCQLFEVSDDMCLLVDHVEMCPDETAFIRVVDEEGYTPLYKRKVRRDKSGNRFIVFNGTNHYLDASKTQPVSIKK